ncbi:HlyD family efflux transporter periplasmic adaptor subunit [Methylobacterium sp. EM32]|uniref:efflux RND transporter periplasmic adaptor subunit n=1 Tax=Methylobacterium sp. EM32 TaxID=3163481 RepID=UPI0033BD6EC5
MSRCILSRTPWILLALLGAIGAPVQAAYAQEVRALLAADREATLTSDGPLLLERIAVDLGDRFEAGQVLARFDCALREARVGAATGVHKGALARLGSKQRLVKLGAIGGLDVELAGAEAQKAEGELAEARTAASHCVLRAPFAGRVAKRHANAHEAVAADRPILSIVSDGPLRLTAIVPSPWLRWLKVGDAFTVRVDETGRSYRASVAALSGRVDPASQSIEILGRIEDARDLLPGMSGTAAFPTMPASQ